MTLQEQIAVMQAFADGKEIECNNISEMRAELFRQRYRSHLIGRVMAWADHEGVSGEDRYTAVAYHLLVETERLRSRPLEMLDTQVPKYIVPVVPADLKERIKGAIERVISGQCAMRIPPEKTDPDLVLADVLKWMEGFPNGQ